MSFLKQWASHLGLCIIILSVAIIMIIIHVKPKTESIKVNPGMPKILSKSLPGMQFHPQYFLMEEKLLCDPFQINLSKDEENFVLQSHVIHLRYAKAEEVAVVLRDKQNNLLSSMSSLVVDKRTNTLLIQEDVQHWNHIAPIITQLDNALKQIALEARIINIDVDKERDLGMDFRVKNNSTSSNEVDSNVNASNARAIVVIKLSSDNLLDVKLDALESQGRVDVIARPRLLTTEQQSAYIESGEEIPYQEAAGEGVTKVAFKKAVLSLRVTPKLIDQKKILLDMQVNQDSRGNALINGVPTINTQQIASQVLVNNGQTIVLGGIYQQTKSNQSQRIPFLSDIPYLGSLFKDRQTSESRKELLIFITPRIVE